MNLKIQTYDLMGEDDLCQQTINEYIKFDTLNAEAYYLKAFYSKDFDDAIKFSDLAIAKDSTLFYLISQKLISIKLRVMIV